jgi:predicted Rossmann fold nucleotide-binding protein DprA/Smf involved in DNA uptake
MTEFLEGQKVAVVGSRGFRDAKLVDRTLSAMKPSLVISGGAKGADQIGETWARRNVIDTLIFHPDHKKYRHPYHHRNRLIAEACDVLVAFWDGQSTGTKYTIGYARRIGKPVVIVRF